jgi:hypothetical protein
MSALQLVMLLCILVQTAAIVFFIIFIARFIYKSKSVEKEALTKVVVSESSSISSIEACNGSPTSAERQGYIQEEDFEQTEEEEEEGAYEDLEETSTTSFEICPRCLGRHLPTIISTYPAANFFGPHPLAPPLDQSSRSRQSIFHPETAHRGPWQKEQSKGAQGLIRQPPITAENHYVNVFSYDTVF